MFSAVLSCSRASRRWRFVSGRLCIHLAIFVFVRDVSSRLFCLPLLLV
ncbi:Uncharacterized protein APZ42_014190 [Daphnia magna]|uniref:Uncharacterized protein n=1 Tax=Daphnia magna TaxID=35525 RepID=A0A162Q1J3_9CRUS|nr:Uncharacterized protein APZ42_014190 [Daphnia magna]